MTGAQQSPRSGHPVLCVRVDQPVIPHRCMLRSTLGYFAATFSSIRAAPVGSRRPCSQSCSVLDETPNKFANSPWDMPILVLTLAHLLHGLQQVLLELFDFRWHLQLPASTGPRTTWEGCRTWLWCRRSTTIQLHLSPQIKRYGHFALRMTDNVGDDPHQSGAINQLNRSVTKRPQNCIYTRLIASPLCLEPFEHILIDS